MTLKLRTYHEEIYHVCDYWKISLIRLMLKSYNIVQLDIEDFLNNC